MSVTERSINGVDVWRIIPVLFWPLQPSSVGKCPRSSVSCGWITRHMNDRVMLTMSFQIPQALLGHLYGSLKVSLSNLLD
jgi:hypothetical protein